MKFIVELSIVCLFSLIDVMNHRECHQSAKTCGLAACVEAKEITASSDHPEISGLVTVPHPKQYIPKGMLRSIFRQAGWSEK